MADEHWWPLLKGSAIIYVGYGGTFTHLSATDFQMRKGPPVTIALDLNGNLRTRNKRSNMYIDAKALGGTSLGWKVPLTLAAILGPRRRYEHPVESHREPGR